MNEIIKKQSKRSFSYSPCKGIFFGGYEAAYTADVNIQTVEAPGLFIGLMLSGRTTSVHVQGTGKMKIPARRPVLMSFSEKTLCSNHYSADEFCAGVGLHIAFDTFNPEMDEQLKTTIHFLQKHYAGITDIESLPPSPQLSLLATRALELPKEVPFWDIEIKAILLNFLAVICRITQFDGILKINGNLTKKERARVELVTEYLQSNLEHTPSLTELAQLAKTNPSTLADNFKTAYQKTIFSFYRELRLDTARTILRCDEVTVTEASLRVGFSSPAAFATAYRKRFGHPPSQEIEEKLNLTKTNHDYEKASVNMVR